MHQRPALEPRKHRRIDLLRDGFVVGEHQPSARPAQSLMRRRGDDMGVREWRRMHAARDKPSEMRHIDHEISADGIGYLAESRKIPIAGIARAAGDDDLWLVLLGK